MTRDCDSRLTPDTGEWPGHPSKTSEKAASNPERQQPAIYEFMT